MSIKVRGSLLLETALALAIIAIVSSIAFGFFDFSRSNSHTPIMIEFRKIEHNLLERNNITDGLVNIEEYTVSWYVKPYQDYTGLKLIELELTDESSNVIHSSKHLINEEN